jgi:hypothetical protein
MTGIEASPTIQVIAALTASALYVTTYLSFVRLARHNLETHATKAHEGLPVLALSRHSHLCCLMSALGGKADIPVNWSAAPHL